MDIIKRHTRQHYIRDYQGGLGKNFKDHRAQGNQSE